MKTVFVKKFAYKLFNILYLIFNIYHFALENDIYTYNYGVYANGLLVESCSKRYLAEIANMTML